MRNAKSRLLLSVILLLAGIVCMGYGAYRGELMTIFQKSIRICLECVGIG